jgi:hypothetical protein
MAKLLMYDPDRQKCDTRDVVDWVEEYGGDRWGSIDVDATVALRDEVQNTRAILARLIDAILTKSILTDEEVTEVIRGY